MRKPHDLVCRECGAEYGYTHSAHDCSVEAEHVISEEIEAGYCEVRLSDCVEYSEWLNS